MPELISGVRQPAARPVDDVDGTGVLEVADVLGQYAYGQVSERVAVEVTARQRRTKAIASFSNTADPVAALAPELVTGVRQPAGRPVEDVDGSGAPGVADLLSWHTHGQVIEPVAVEVTARQRGAKEIGYFGDTDDPWAVLAPELVPDVRQPAARPVEDVDCAGNLGVADVLPGHAHGQVSKPVAVEVTACQRQAKEIVGFGGTLDSRAVLVPELVTAVRQPTARPVDDGNGAGARGAAADVLAGHAHGEILHAIAVEVTACQRDAKAIVGLGITLDPGAVLVPELVACVGQPAA